MTNATLNGFVPGRHPLDAYGAGGFRFADMSHRGSILALPSGVYAWAAAAPGEITTSSLAQLFKETHGLIDLLLVGTGHELVRVPALLRLRLADFGVKCEAMQTGSAARTYNVLLGENRRVAAALLAVD